MNPRWSQSADKGLLGKVSVKDNKKPCSIISEHGKGVIVCYADLERVNLGSRASRKPSPSRLKASTVSIIAIPGKITR
jgi:hypothetical protein